MPERPLTIATYAAGASLAAATLIYVFGPTFFFDDKAANSSSSSRKKGVVGLSNPANDCFINSVLQALAGLPELRLYLIREVHRRKLDGPEMYQDLSAAFEEQLKNAKSKELPQWKLLGLQQGIVTAGLKTILDALNERPLYKKTMSAQAFIRVVEEAFRIRMSRAQQDAHEFLQIVAERLNDENHAARRARRYAAQSLGVNPPLNETRQSMPTIESDVLLRPAQAALQVSSALPSSPRDSKIEPLTEAPHWTASDSMSTSATEVGMEDEKYNELFIFPLEGKLESQVECSYCSFKPRPHISTFVTLTLHVPQNSSSSSLNSCFDGMFKQEQIDDFTCDRCRLDHALQINAKHLSKAVTVEDRTALERDAERIEEALREDPEKPPEGVKLPVLSTVPKRRISRHMRMSTFPRVLSLHLSRSVWDAGSSSSKNTSKITFPETLSLGSLMDRKTYRLLAVVTHKGGHNSGHYETFRRQFLSAPYSTPTSLGNEGIYGSRSSPAPSPKIPAETNTETVNRDSEDLLVDSQSSSPVPQTLSTPPLETQSISSSSSPSRNSTVQDRRKPPPTSVPLEAMPTPGLPPLPQERQAGQEIKRQSSLSSVANRIRRKKGPDRWWRISDDKIKECKTSDVLGMQREVYLLFYELVDEEHA